MDPNANLEEQLRLAARLMLEDGDDRDALRLAELVKALDAWLTNGGFLPQEWADAHRKPKRDDAQAVHDVVEILEGQLPQGNENAARHIVACLDALGRK